MNTRSRRSSALGHGSTPGNVRRLAPGGVAVVLALVLGGCQDSAEGALETFHSRPDLTPPVVSVEKAMPSPASGYTFVAPWRGEGQSGPMILDGRGEMVWFHPVPPEQEAMDFRVQRYRGRPVLTWWEGFVDEDGYGHGEYVIANRSYEEIARFRPAGRGLGDFHEFVLTPRDTALITVYREVRRDMSAVGGPVDGTLLESIVQEVDVETGRALLDWRATDHVDLAESHEEVPDEPDEAFDHFHVNSIDVDHDGDLLVSARHTDTVYKIDRRTGEVLWRLGGERSDFTFGPRAGFYSQHDARRQPDGDITLFDNSNPPQVREQSRAIRLRLDLATMRAELVGVANHPEELSSDSQGNTQVLPGGDMVVGWGSEPYFSRFSEDGRLRFDARFPEDTDVYRTYQAPWSGRPPGRPALVVDAAEDDEVVAHASWNGATEVARWQLLAGPRPGELHPVAVRPWQGFETTITARTRQPYLAVRALGRSGDPQGVSATVQGPR